MSSFLFIYFFTSSGLIIWCICITLFGNRNKNYLLMTSLVAQMVKCLPTMWEARVSSLGGEDLLEKGMETHSRTLACKIPWMEKCGRL